MSSRQIKKSKLGCSRGCLQPPDNTCLTRIATTSESRQLLEIQVLEQHLLTCFGVRPRTLNHNEQAHVKVNTVTYLDSHTFSLYKDVESLRATDLAKGSINLNTVSCFNEHIPKFGRLTNLNYSEIHDQKCGGIPPPQNLVGAIVKVFTSHVLL